MKRNVLLAMAVAIAGLGVIGLTWAQDDEGPTSSLKFVVCATPTASRCGMRRWCCIR